ncbi:MAG: NAD(+) diphosphatase [Geminicoccaceae bacterium]|nr:MAG: NAD(+) diphosphatase [Geminicoccaceae bacterium]
MHEKITNAPPHRYSHSRFDRGAPFRKDPQWLAAKRRDPRTRLLLTHDLKAIVRADAPTRLHLVELAHFAEAVPETAVLLGIENEVAIFALALETGHELTAHARDLREIGPTLEAGEAGLAAYARALFYWHQTHGFCSRCGSANHPADGGHARHCPACDHTTFPRTDPAVIILVSCGDHCLLGRSPRFPEGMYSTLAGFVEPGESLEDTIRREVFEEAGVEVVSMRYRSSQPWPFPASLMLGFHGTARSRALDIDKDELEDARWFHKSELLDPHRRPITLPRPDSIARYLIESWLYEG